MQKANVTKQDDDFEWNSIKWKEINGMINNLRQRLYRATEEGNLKKVRSLQKLILRSRSNKLQAIRKVTLQNSGKNTSGVDGIVAISNRERVTLYKTLSQEKEPRPQATKRVYIPKANGERRPLGLPTIAERCRQAIVKTSLEPYWESKFEVSSYGFRPGRSAHDAIQKIFGYARSGKSRPWILEADIKGAFDNISHEFLLKQLKGFPARKQIEMWLKAGFQYQGKFTPTISGTPQGGVISPLLANIALHGMEKMLGMVMYQNKTLEKSPYAFVRYADDFVIFAKTQQSCEEAKIKLMTWLKERGLEVSEEKTRIVHLEEGFDFLGFNIRRYKTQAKKKGCVLLTKPSHESVKKFKQELRRAWIEVLGWKRVDAIRYLNKKIVGWRNYFKIAVSKRTFSKLSHWMFKRQERYLYRMHPNKHWHWYRSQYFGTIAGRKDRWVFQDKKTGIYLEKLDWAPIKRHVMIAGNASPDNPKLKEYWRKRQRRKNPMMTLKKQILWRKQQGICPCCLDKLDNGEINHTHHIKPKALGIQNNLDNLVILHAACHRQVHSKKGQDLALGLLEPYAG